MSLEELEMKFYCFDFAGVYHEIYLDAIKNVTSFADRIEVVVTNKVQCSCSGHKLLVEGQEWLVKISLEDSWYWRFLEFCKENQIKFSTPSCDSLV